MDCHMMVANPEQVRYLEQVSVESAKVGRVKWVDDIAKAGGSLYCFHVEATCINILVVFRTGLSSIHSRPFVPDQHHP